MELSEILNSLTAGEQTKTASENNNTATSLEEAIDRALASAGTHEVKEASLRETPSNDLLKIAQDLSNAEQEALLKEATIYGRAVADGFAARLTEYSAPQNTVSQANPALIKQAMELGYSHAMQAINSANNQEMYKQAQAHQEHAPQVSPEEDAVKVAYYLQGQEDAGTALHNLVKVASSYEDYGFKVGNSILKKLG